MKRHNDWRQLCLTVEFYGAPIQLESVHGEEALGRTYSVLQGATTVRRPTNATLLRTLASAGRAS